MTELLSHPALYIAVQRLIGATRARRLIIENEIAPGPGWRVLDIGCGPGYLAPLFGGASYVGVDTCDAYIRYAKAHYAAWGTFHCFEITDETIRQFQNYDVVMLFGVLHHLDDPDAVALLTRLRLALKPGGKMITLDGYFSSDMSPWRRYILRSDRGKFVREEPAYRRLALSAFNQVDTQRFDHLFYIPYNLLVMSCRQTQAP